MKCVSSIQTRKRGKCPPLLLAEESGPDDTNPPDGLPSARTSTSEGFVISFAPSSPLSPRSTIPPVLSSKSPVQVHAASSTQALLPIPTRGGDACMPGYLHTALPLPFGDASKTQFAPHVLVETMTWHRRQRRRPAPLTLHLPAHTVRFEDSLYCVRTILPYCMLTLLLFTFDSAMPNVMHPFCHILILKIKGPS